MRLPSPCPVDGARRDRATERTDSHDAARARRRRVVRGWAALIAVGVVTLTACSDTDTSGAAFCSALNERMSVIDARVRNAADIDALVSAYEELDARTPLAIAEPWTDLTDLLRTAATVAPEDRASVQALADAAYATERSARAVATWVAGTCGFAMPAMQGMEGPVAPPPTTKHRGRTTTSAP